MGEIDTKSIESVQSALSFFDGQIDQKKSRTTSGDDLAKERELEGLLKDLANYKVQLEVKESAYKQALLKLDHCQTAANEFYTMLKNSEFEKDMYIAECKEARMKTSELELQMVEMEKKVLETVKMRGQLSETTKELKATQEELLAVEIQLAAARGSKLEAMTQAELMETELHMEKAKTGDLLGHVSELKEAILHLKMDVVDGENEKCLVLSEKEAELELVRANVAEAQKQLDHLRKQLEMMDDLENQVMTKSVLIDLLKLELQQASGRHCSFEETASHDLNQLKLDLELQERKNMDRASHIGSLEMELDWFKVELEKANEELSHMNLSAETKTVGLGKVKGETEKVRRRETEAQIEIAMLKAELHKGRSKIAAAEAAEARAKSEKSCLYFAVRQLALEAEAAKKGNRRLTEEAQKAAGESKNTVLVNPHYDNSSLDSELPQMSETATEDEEKTNEVSTQITISVEELEALMKKADQVAEPVPENGRELEAVKRELEIAMVKIGEFRTRAEQAVSRAEVAEKAKADLEDRLRRWREKRERRKAAVAALQEESVPQESNSLKYENIPKTYQPLGKVLNMKF